jgi:molybdopterin-containing oxidoreductase family membrane subunit
VTHSQPPDRQRRGLVSSLKALAAFVLALAVGGLSSKRRQRREADSTAHAAQHEQHPRQDSEMLRSEHSYASLTRKISAIPTRPVRGTSLGWLAAFGLAALLLMLLVVSIIVLFVYGVGIWGINVPVAWGFAIINFVWWIGIGHAGTLISAVLLLLNQNWRNPINRLAEAMTLVAVVCAGIFPILHLGRPELFYWLIPYPNRLGMWPQFRSPLTWDVFAITTYGLVSLLFWLIGLLPDLATLRDQARSPLRRRVYGVLALGWRGSARHWHHYEMAYLLLAGLATPLVVSVHSIVAFDFAVGQTPGWHTTFFPPYFVAGAIFSGFAMVLTLVIPLRAIYGLHDFITDKHLSNMAKVLLATSQIVLYGYLFEAFYAWYSGNEFERSMMLFRMFGPYAFAYWLLIICNGLIPQVFWVPSLRRSVPLLFVVSIIVNIGMWTERFVIVITSLSHDFMPSSWGMFYPTFWDWATLAGTFGLFLVPFLLFIRVLPMINEFEMQHLLHHEKHRRRVSAEEYRPPQPAPGEA